MFFVFLLGEIFFSSYTLANPSVYKISYPDAIADVTATHLLWKDGTIMSLDDRDCPLTSASKMHCPSLRDQISIAYPQGPHATDCIRDPACDPGRMRYVPFFQKMYGATEADVRKNIVKIPWLPQTFGSQSTIEVTSVNGVAEKLTKISEALDALPPPYKKYLADPGGTFNFRTIAGTNRLSAHSFGMTIDINVAYSHYWLWDYKKRHPGQETVQEEDIHENVFPYYSNKIPWEIIAIFEKNHFIWGGKWHHYDTMHFEYRPELFPPS